MQTLQQLLKSAPALAASTENLAYQKRVRRAAIEAIKKLEATTSPRDLTRKVIAEMTNTEAKMKLLFTPTEMSSYSKAALVWNKLEQSISLSINVYLGLLQKSNLECEMVWNKAKKTVLKHEEGNLDIHLGGQKDSFRVYITNPDTLVAQCENVDVSQYLDKDVKDRGSFTAPRQATFIQLSDTRSLMLFSDPRNAQQRRFIVSNDKVKHFTFEPIGTYYCQDGTHIARKEYTGREFDVNKYGESVSPKEGLMPSVFVVDASFRGRMGDIGATGPRGEKGVDRNQFGYRAQSLQLELLEKGKRLVSNAQEYQKALRGEDGWVIPMKTSLIRSWSKEIGNE